jgi:uncharacterized protein (TIGR02594 family)
MISVKNAHNKYCPWMAYAIGELGETEIPGQTDNPRIVEYHAATGLSADDDETPWCASFVSWCLEQAGIKSMRSARARDYLDFGDILKEPQIGCIVILTRTGGGHVGFYWGKSANGKINLLGGNQGNAVTVASYDASRVIGYRWPADVKVSK